MSALGLALLITAASSSATMTSVRAQMKREDDYRCRLATAVANGTVSGSTFVSKVNFALTDINGAGSLPGQTYGDYGGQLDRRSFEAKSTASVLLQTPQANGDILAITTHVFEVYGLSDGDGVCEPDENCFTTLDEARLQPTTTANVFRINTNIAIVSNKRGFDFDGTNTRPYQNASRYLCGKLSAVDERWVANDRPNQVNFANNTISWTAIGTLCDCLQP